MPDESSLITLTSATFPLEQGYFRSKIYTAPPTINPFLTAASPLFSLLERLTATQTLPTIDVIKNNIDHEWRAFRSRLSCLKATPEFLVVAEYLVSATLDEVIGKTYLRVQGTPAEFIAYTRNNGNAHGPEKHCFELVHFMQKHPNQYLDLLELAYYCLTCGFEGEYHSRADGRQALDNLMHELFQTVTEHRAHKPIRLFKDAPPQVQIDHEKLHPHFWRTLTLGFSLIGLLLMGTQVLLSEQAKTIFTKQTAQQIAMESHG